MAHDQPTQPPERKYGASVITIPALEAGLRLNGWKASGQAWLCKYDGQPFSAASLAFLGKPGRVLTESPAVCPQAQLDKQNRLSHARRPRRSGRRWSGRVFSSDLDEYIPNGAFIIALAIAGCTLKRVNFDSLNAKSSAWPSHEATTRMAFSHEIVGAREQLADPSTVQRNVLQAFARAATGTDIAAWPEFWEWVCGRRAQDNPLGDFVRDTRAVREDRNGAEGWHEACLLRLAVASALRPWNPDVVGPMPAFKHWARRYIAELTKK